MALPQSILLKSNKNNKLLRYRKEEDSHHAFLQFSQDEEEKNPEVQYAKFEVEKSKTVEGYVHIRSCYNHEYWVRKSADSKWIVVEANEPEEDQSKWCCTLFKAVLIDDDADATVPVDDVLPKPQKIQLVHIDQLGQQACVQSSETTDLVVIGDEDEGSKTTSSRAPDVFIAYNASSVFVLPDYIAVMGPNDKYGAPTRGVSLSGAFPPFQPVHYLEFKTTDIGHHGVIHSIEQNTLSNPPLVLLKNTSMAASTDNEIGYWKVREGFEYITMDIDRSTVTEVFTPIHHGENRVAFRKYRIPRLFTNSLVYRGSFSQFANPVLGLTSITMDLSTIFRVVEPVVMRQVSNVVFLDARLYNVGQVQKYSDDRINDSTVEQSGVFRVSYKTTQTQSWNDSITLTRTMVASWSSKVPFIGEFGVEYAHERTQTVEWGNVITEEKTVEYEQSVTMPPGKRMVLTVMATKADCDIPFRCQVRDTMTDGTIRVYTKIDGLFVGSNEFSFRTIITEPDL